MSRRSGSVGAPGGDSWGDPARACGPPFTACRCTRRPCIWRIPSACTRTEKRNPLREPVDLWAGEGGKNAVITANGS